MANRRNQPKRARAQTANMGRRRRKRRGRRVLLYGFLLFCLLTVGAVYFFTEYMKIESIEVVGVDKYTPDDVIVATGIEVEQNLLKVDTEAVRQKVLEEFPYIKSADVKRRYWPPKVEITVEQAEPVGAILQDGEVVLIDNEGKVLERGVLLVPESLLLVKGVDAKGAVPGDYLGAYTPPDLQKELEPLVETLEQEGRTKEEISARKKEELDRRKQEEQVKQEYAAGIRERLTMLRYLLDAMQQSGFTQLTNVDLSDRLNMRVNYENRITLELGGELKLVDKLKTALHVLQTDIGPEESGTLDVTNVEDDVTVFDPVPSRRYHYDNEEVSAQPPEEDPEQPAEGDEPEDSGRAEQSQPPQM